jgi:hypothetical protein
MSIGRLNPHEATVEVFPHSNTGCPFLLEELRGAVQNLPIDKSLAPLLMWLSLIGAAASKMPEQEWFVCHLARLVATPGYISSEEELDLTRFPSVRPVLGSGTVDRIWEDVMVAKQSHFLG